MDSILIPPSRPAHLLDAELTLCLREGIAFQTDLSYSAALYSDAYFAKVNSYDPEIESRVVRGRIAMVDRHLPFGASLVDWGSGSGRFLRAALKAGYQCRGFDVMTASVEALKASGHFIEGMSEEIDGLAMWDTIEHLEQPEAPLLSLRIGGWAFISVPIFDDLRRIRESKHYRPGEHLFYWTRQGFERSMLQLGYRLLEASDHEIDAGREAVWAFAFRREGGLA